MVDTKDNDWLEAGSFEHPVLLRNSSAGHFAAKRSSLGDELHLTAHYRWEDLLLTASSIPKGSIVIKGNISPGTEKQQGVSFSIDSSDYGALIDLMMKSSPKRTMEAIAKATAAHAMRLPEENWFP